MDNKNKSQAHTMQSHLEACKASCITVRDYCLRHGIKHSSYYYWQKKLLPQQAGKFISITPPAAIAGVSVTFTNGNRISFECMPPAEYIKQLMS